MTLRPAGALTALSTSRLAVVAALLVVAAGESTKLVFRFFLARDGAPIPVYGITTGLTVAVIGLAVADIRGLILAGAGAASSAVSAVVLLATTTGHLNALVYGMPLALVGAAGLATFAHGIVHSRPSLARWGVTAIGWGVAGFLFALVYLGGTAIGRATIHNTPVGTAITVVVVLVCAGGAIYVVARDKPARTTDGADR
jgi:hypothetical protein